MNLGRQIHTLLKIHTAVFVQGLGTFKRIHTSASFDVKRKIVLPPLTFIEFEKDVEDGYDFILYLQKFNQIERAEAESQVHDQVQLLISEINRTGEVVLEELGHLIQYGNFYIFKPLNLNGFEYVPLDDPYLKVTEQEVHVDVFENIAANATEVVEEILTEKPVEKEVVTKMESDTIVEEVSPAVGISESEEITKLGRSDKELAKESKSEEVIFVEKEKSKGGNGFIYALVAALAIIVLGGLYYYNTITKNVIVKEDNLAAVDSLETDFQDSVLSELDSALLALTDSVQVVIPDSTEAKTVEKPIVQERKEHKFAIVIGTHKNLAQAYDEAKAFNKDGHKSVRVLTPNLTKNLKRVVWDTYPTREQRDSALRHVRKHVKADAWGTELN